MNDAFLSLGSAFVLPAAPFLGSFIATLAIRIANPGSLILGRSACLHCRHNLGFRDLIPFLSWLASAGRCRYCRTQISLLYPAAELAALAIAAISVTALPPADSLIACGFGWTLLALALIDLRHHLLPDAITLPLTAAGLALAWLHPGDLLLERALGCVLGFSIFYFISMAYRYVRKRDGLGLGDAKLLAAGGAWVAWQGLPSVVVLAGTAALVVVALQIARGRRVDAKTRIPFGLYLSPAIWLIWLIGPLKFG
ncbi:MAG: A24 family peptidase [Proteobacteria bacterium]|nr:A24 family peptidase [Pseudomonadota bacterium]